MEKGRTLGRIGWGWDVNGKKLSIYHEMNGVCIVCTAAALKVRRSDRCSVTGVGFRRHIIVRILIVFL